MPVCSVLGDGGIKRKKECKTEEAIDAAIIPPEVDELTDEGKIEHERMIINDGGDELSVKVLGTFDIHAAINDRTVPKRQLKIVLKKQNRKRRTQKNG
ncbi:hypothetical protein GWI33_020440 [Rhynchophorus ferrugineus]|uniref:Uncharacterized protein n=1 Tax=Rhynchophorus ferrugineus TaxID=354439 RepID=A0A834I3D4_RHYFE|nr:hypothetical protein GWI33_020440 [Rhynchophorus ferrugineus]